MKKITSKVNIVYRVDGNTVLEISPKGCLADDGSAARALAVLGSNISVEDIDADEAVSQVQEESPVPDEKQSDDAAPVEEGSEDAKPKRGGRGKTK